jgi:hypothetical protein
VKLCIIEGLAASFVPSVKPKLAVQMRRKRTADIPTPPDGWIKPLAKKYLNCIPNSNHDIFYPLFTSAERGCISARYHASSWVKERPKT